MVKLSVQYRKGDSRQTLECKEKNRLEEFVSGSLSDEESQQFLAHLTECPECRKEAGFLTAVRLSMPSSLNESDCLSDETFVALADGLLGEEDRKATVAHMARCDHCLRSWLSLTRALAEVDRNPVEVPRSLLNKAIQAIPEAVRKPPLLQRLLGPSPFFRFALAASAAAAVFVLTILLTGPPVENSKPGLGAEPLLAEAPSASDPGLSAPPTVADHDLEPEPGEKPGPAIPSPEPRDEPAVAEAVPETKWLDDLDETKRLDLLSRLGSQRPAEVEVLVKALATTEKSAVVEGYLLGKSMGTVETFSRFLETSPGTRTHLTRMISSVAALLKSSKALDTEKLFAFADGLGQKMAAGKISADTAILRLEVFQEAIQDSLEVNQNATAGYELGRLSSRLTLLAIAQDAGYKPPRQSWPSREAVARVRRLLEKNQSLPDKVRYNVLNSLKSIGVMSRAPDAPSKATRILDEMQLVDQNIRAVR
jgi:hypothetical protein